MIHTVKGFSVVSEADVFLELSCFFCDPTDVGNFISGSSAFSKSSLYIWKFSVHVLLKPRLKDFEHYLASMWSKINCGSLLLWIKPKPSCTSFSVDIVFIFLGYVSMSGIAGSHDNSLFSFLRNWQNVLQGGYLLTMYMSFNFSTFSSAFVFLVFGSGHANEWEVVFHCGFDLLFPDDWWCWASFQVLTAVYAFVCWRNVCSHFLPILSKWLNSCLRQGWS